MELINLPALLIIFLALSVIILRRQQPDIPRKFKCPLVPVVPILSIIFCVFLIFQLSHTTLERFVVSLIIGLAVYLAYGRRNSKLNDKKSVKDIESFYYELKGYKFLKKDSE